MNIFVAKLSPITTSEDLQEAFSEYGRVRSAKVLIDFHTGHSKGIGFVEIDDYTEAQNAIEALNGSELHGSVIIVKAARPREGGYDTNRKPRPKIEVGKEKASRKEFPKGERFSHKGDKKRPKEQDRRKPGFQTRQNRGEGFAKARKPQIREYSMMELMEDDD